MPRTGSAGPIDPPGERVRPTEDEEAGFAEWADAVVAALSLDEASTLVAGADAWHTRAIERDGVAVPSLKVTDGPNGARGDATGQVTAACFPVGTALAATWNTELLAEVGAALAEEAISKGAQVLLGPTVNIHRSPLAGRNFECYSEDPHLSARLAVAFVEGLQARGVGACVKHFICNDSEYQRMTIDSVVDERSLREIYFPPFEAAVREAGAWSVMGAYNRVNGVYACANRRLITDLLKGELAFDGVVISDWGAVHDTVATADAGLDLEMPGPPVHFGGALADAVRSGAASRAVVDDKVRRLLRLMWRTGLVGAPARGPEVADDRPAHRALARRAAAESIVVLKNEGVLPLSTAAFQRLAVIGPNAEVGTFQGGGSSFVRPHYVVHPAEALRQRAGSGVDVSVETGCEIHRYAPQPAADHFVALDDDGRGLRIEYFDGDEPEGDPVGTRSVRFVNWVWWGRVPDVADPQRFAARWTGTYVAQRSGRHVFELASTGRCRMSVDGALVVDNWTAPVPGDIFFSRGSREVTGALDLVAGERVELCVEFSSTGLTDEAGPAAIHFGVVPPGADDLLDRAVAAAAEADMVIAIVGTNGDFETEGSDRATMALPGRQDELVERVVRANPRTVVVLNTGSPVSMPWVDAVPAVIQAWFGGQELGNALADVLFGDVDATGRLPTTFPRALEDNPAFHHYPGEGGAVRYGEGIFVGYRGYDASGVEPLFCFGHGLSYTTFEYGGLACSLTGPGRSTPDGVRGVVVDVSVTVTNTGDRAGAEVVQLYVRDLESSLDRPDRELRAFTKVRPEPGRSEVVTFRLGDRSFAAFHPDRDAWVVEPGAFEIIVGSSSRDPRARCVIELG